MPVKNKDTVVKRVNSFQEKDNAKLNEKWWKVKKENMYGHIKMVTDEIINDLAIRRRMNYFFSTLYNDIGASYTSSPSINLYYNRAAIDGNAITSSRMTMNVLQNVIDTAVSLIAKNKPKPEFVTDGAKSYNVKVRGKKLTKYVGGVFEKNKIYQICQRVFQDSCIYGTGAIKIFASEGEIKAEWVFIEEILVNELDGMNQDPTQLHQRKYIPRDVLIEQFPDYEEKINSAAQISGSASTFSDSDLIPVTESWHLPSGKKAKDGKHVISIDNCTLFLEDYKKDYFPILFYRWANQTLGFWGRGISHEIWKSQIEVDTLLRLVQQSMRLVGGPIIAVESGSNISEEHITSNRVAKIVEYAAVPPAYLTPPTIQPEILQHLQFLIAKMYEVAGVSEANATGNKPKGVESSVAIESVSDIASGRFQCNSQAYEDLHLDIARVIVDLSTDLLQDNKSLSIFTKDKKGGKRLDFKEAVVDLEDCEIQVFPVSGLPNTPAGRMDKLMEYVDRGAMTTTQMMDIVDYPDLEDTTSLETASLNLTQQILSNIKEYGEYIAPGPYLELETAYRMSALEVDRATLENVEEANIKLLQRWCNECKDALDDLKAEQAASQPAPQPAPMQAAPNPNMQQPMTQGQ